MSLVFSCRVYGVLREGDKILLTRSHFRGREFVNYPGVGIEIEEAPRAALLREFSEETGLVVRPVRALYVSEGAHLSTQMSVQIVSAYWLVERVSGEPRMGGNGNDVRSLFWADLNALPTAEMFPSDKEFSAVLPGLLGRPFGGR